MADPVTPTLPENPTLEDLQRVLGAADPDLLAAMNPPESQEPFRLVGAQIGSARVVTDETRLLGIAVAFWLKASEEQKALCKGCTTELLAIAVDRSIALEAMAGDFARRGTADKSARVVLGTTAGAAYQKGAGARERAQTGLRTVVGTHETRRAELATAVGTIGTPESLAQSLERLAALTDKYLADPATKARAKVAGLGADDGQALLAQATAVRAEAKAASGRLTSNITGQGDLDILDGLCLDLLSHVIHAFDAGHDADGSIPRLVPQSTRRILASRTKKPAVSEPPPAPTPNA